MSAPVLRSPTPAAARAEAAPAQPAAPAGLASEPSLLNRLLGVAAVVFAVPVLLELRRLAVQAGAGPTLRAEAWLFAASAALAAAFAFALLRAPRRPELRAGRALWLLLAAEACVLGAALLAHAAR